MNDSKSASTIDLITITCEDAAAWEAWLVANHDRASGVWLKVAKKGSGVASVTISEALDGALCYGWIDGQRKSCDSTWYLQKYTPRRPRSAWSMVNVRKVEALSAAGRMRPAGVAQVEAAKADGRWDAAYVAQRDATVPPDLEEALQQNDRARTAFDGLGKTAKYQIIVHLERARRPETRTRRLERAIADLAARVSSG